MHNYFSVCKIPLFKFICKEGEVMKYKSDVIVIGSGIGGLSAGAYLANNGYKVKMFERINQPGGYVNTFKRNDYWFESAIHQLAYLDVNKLKSIGIKELEIIRLQHAFEAILYKDLTITKRYLIDAGMDESWSSLKKHFPDDIDSLNRFKKIFDEMNKDIDRLERIQQKISLKTILDVIPLLFLLKAKKGSLLHKLGSCSYKGYARYSQKRWNELYKYFNNPDLKYLFSLYGIFCGTSPETISALIMGIVIKQMMFTKPYFVKGGTGKIISGCINTLKNNNSVIHYNSEVEKIITKNNKAVGVRLTNGEEHYARKIISNVNAYITYNDLLKDLSIENTRVSGKLNNYKSSKALFQVYVGLPYSLSELGYKSSTTFITSSNELDPLFDVRNTYHTREPLYILTDYSSIDPSFSRPGTTSLVVAVFDDYKRWENLSTLKYKEQKRTAQSLILDKLEKITSIPFSKADITFSATPITFKRYSGNIEGGFTGQDHHIDRTLQHRFSNITPVRNLFLAGSDTFPGGGFINALNSGITTGRIIHMR